MTEKQTPLAGIPSDWNSKVTSPTEFRAGVHWAYDRIVEEPWVVSKARPGERMLDIGSAASGYLVKLPSDCKVYGIDIRRGPAQPGIALMQADVMRSPFRPGTFDAITCVSTIEHIGLPVYGQHGDRFGDEVAMRHMRQLLRPGGRLLLTTPFGKGAIHSWLRVYNKSTFGRLIGGFKAVSIEYYKREGEQYLRCQPDDLATTGFDHEKLRSDGLVMAELVPVGGLPLLIARLSLRLRRVWHFRTQRRYQFWTDPA